MRVFCRLLGFWVVFLGLAVATPASAQDSYDWLVDIDDVVSGVNYDPTSAGLPIRSRITVTNNGPDTAPATTLSFVYQQDRATFTGSTGTITGCTSATFSDGINNPPPPFLVSIGFASGTIVTCSVPSLDDEASADIVATFDTSIATVVTLVARVPRDPADTNTNNDRNSETITVTDAVDLEIDVVAPDNLNSGQVFTFNANIRNVGPNTATSYRVSIPVPTGITNITPPAACSLQGTNYICNISTALPSGGTAATLAFTGQISANGPSTIGISGFVDNATPTDPIPGNNSDVEQISVAPGTDVSIAKTRTDLDGAPLLEGDLVNFTLTTRYTGNAPTGTTVVDNVPANYEVLGITTTGGYVCDDDDAAIDPPFSNAITCVGPSGSGAGVNQLLGTITIQTRARVGGAATGVQNTATVTSTGPTEQNNGNNSASDGPVTIQAPVVDPAARKTGPRFNQAIQGRSYDYGIYAVVLGNADFVGTMTLTDQLPTGVTLNSISNTSGYACSVNGTPITAPRTFSPAIVGPAAIQCTRTYTTAAPLVRNLSEAASARVLYNVTINNTGAVANTMTVSFSGSNVSGNDPSNDSVTLTAQSVSVGNEADVSVTKSGSDPATGTTTAVAGQPYTYRIEVLNAGPNAAANVRVRDTFSNLQNGNQAFQSVSVTNALASSTCLQDLPSGQSRRLECTINSVPVCTAGVNCPVISVTVIPGRNANPRSNTVEAFSLNTPDPEYNNNTTTISHPFSPRVDMTVTKTAPANSSVGVNLTYVITARNTSNGLSTAQNVTVTDILPPNVTFVSARNFQGTACATAPAPGTVSTGTTANATNTIICSLGNITNGSQQTATVVVRPNFATVGTDLVNNVRVDTTTTETNLDNNTNTATTRIAPPNVDILINKDDDVDPLALGADVIYSVSVTNAGPSSSEQIVITDDWPDSVISFQAIASTGGATCPTVPAVNSFGQQIICQIPLLLAGETVTLQFRGRGDARGAAINEVRVSSAEILAGYDRELANNFTEENTTVRPRADIQVVSKTSVPATAGLREVFEYRVLVRANTGTGLNEAQGVVFTDNLPANMRLSGAPTFSVVAGVADPTRSCSGAVGGTTVSCQLNTISPNEQILVTIPVRVISVTSDPATVRNTASVTTTSIEVAADRTNNSNFGDVSIVSSSIAGNVFRDFADNVTKEAGDTNVTGVPITLTGTTIDGVTITPVTINTDANGNFLFSLLPAGTYTISRGAVSENYLVDGTNTNGTIGGASQGSSVTGNSIVGIVLPTDSDSVDNIFRLVPQARVGIAKSGEIDALNDDGSFNASFDLTVENFSLEPLINVTVTDQLAGAAPLFGTFVSLIDPANDALSPGQYTVLNGGPTGTCGTLNAAYDGSANTTLAGNGTLAVGGTCTLSFTIRVKPTAAQLSTRFENQAVVVAQGDLSSQTSATNPQLRDLSDDGVDPDPNGNARATDSGEDDPTPIRPTFTSGIALVKSADLTAVSDPISEGDLVTYRFAVTNTGTVTLSDITIVEDLLTAVVSGTIATLAPGDTDTVSIAAAYNLTQDDIDAGEVENSATVTGTDPFGVDVRDISGATITDDDPLVTALVREPAIAIVKTANTDAVQAPTQEGDVITYSFAVTNTGNVTLTDVTVTDPLPGLVLSGTPIASLLPGQTNSVVYSASYTVDYDDIESGEVPNRATVTGTAPDGSDVSDESGPTMTTDQDTVVPLSRVPAIEATKTQVFNDDGDGRDSIGDLVTYTITLQNNGNVPLTDVALTDTLTDLNGVPLSLTTGPSFVSADRGSDEGALLQGETATYTATYVLELQAVNAFGVINSVDASATGVSGDDGGPGTEVGVSDRSDDGDDTDGNSLDDPTVLNLDPASDDSNLSMVKTTPLTIVSRGDVVPYSIVVTNGNSFVEGPFDIVDRLPEGLVYIPGSATVDGEEAEVTFTAGTVTWSGVTVPALGTLEVMLDARVLNGARAGDLVNRVSLRDPATGENVVDDQTATVTLLPDALFECSDVIGKVFNDVNGNGYQDPAGTIGRGTITNQDYLGGKGKIEDVVEPRDELGIPGVRLATVDGTVITTDENGLYSVPCAALPANGGSNFILKVDERSLPAGYRMTTENPLVSRLTPGMMAEMNFGAAVALQVVRVDLTAASFVLGDGGPQMSPALQAGISGVLQQIAGSPSTIVLSFYVSQSAGERDIAQARSLLDLVESRIRVEWREVGRVRLLIEQNIVRAGK